MGPTVRLSETSPYWARPSVPLGYNEPVWRARAYTLILIGKRISLFLYSPEKSWRGRAPAQRTAKGWGAEESTPDFR